MCGGESLLHPDLLEILEISKLSGVADNVVLLTNGVLLHKMPTRLFELVDRLRVSVYPGVNVRMSRDELLAISKKYNFVLNYNRYESFQQIFLNHRNDDEVSVNNIFRECNMLDDWSCESIRHGYYYKCASPVFLAERLARIGKTVEGLQEKDGVRFRDNKNLLSELETYFSSTTPLETCQWCLGTSGKSYPHRQLHQQNLNEELEATAQPVSELLQKQSLGQLFQEIPRKLKARLRELMVPVTARKTTGS